jgi:two-component system sensor histidine kinase KdpD
VTIARPVHLVALLLYVANALLVSLVVDQAARRTRAARRSAAESELLASIAGGVIRGQDALQALVTRTREAFRLSGARLRTGGRTVAEDGRMEGDAITVPVGDRAELELFGPEPSAADRRVLGVVVAQIDAALEQAALLLRARELQPLEETDRVRSALLAAVGHDLRRPLAVATAAVTGLRSPATRLTDNDRAELLAGAERALGDLDVLITNLLDVSRVQAGALAVSLRPVDTEDLLPPVLEELHLAPGEVELAIPADLPPIRADAILLQRAIVNIVANALRFSPPGSPPRLSASAFGDRVEIRIADRGPGVPAEQRAALFQAFQRSGDSDNSTGIGLGLALSQGFVEGMGGTLEAEDTPGGGLTMVLTLPLAAPDAPVTQPEAVTA